MVSDAFFSSPKQTTDCQAAASEVLPDETLVKSLAISSKRPFLRDPTL